MGNIFASEGKVCHRETEILRGQGWEPGQVIVKKSSAQKMICCPGRVADPLCAAISDSQQTSDVADWAT